MVKNLKSILLAGGAGSRLYPLTEISSKQLQPVFDKPMIYYSLSTILDAGVQEVCLISTPDDIPRYKKLLGNGNRFGISIEYREQAKPQGIAQSLIIASDFICGKNTLLILGDNIFSGGSELQKAISNFESGALIFAYRVPDPERYGVVEFDSKGSAISLEEKPKTPKSKYAVPGLYLYDFNACEVAKNLKPSARGELEITDVNKHYLSLNKLKVHKLNKGFAWLDAGTTSALQEASNYVSLIEKRQGIKIGCPEESAYLNGFLSRKSFKNLVNDMPFCEYRTYLEGIIDD